MWNILKKLYELFLSIKEWFSAKKTAEVQQLQADQAKQTQEIQQENDEAQAKMADANYSGDSFESALDKLRREQQLHS